MTSVVYTITILILLVGVLVIFFTLYRKKEKITSVEEYLPPGNFILYNYLPNHNVRVDVATLSLKTSKNLPPSEYSTLPDIRGPTPYVNVMKDKEGPIDFEAYYRAGGSPSDFVYQDQRILVPLISSNSTSTLQKQDVVNYLRKGNVLRIYVTPKEGGQERHYSDYLVDTDTKERIKNIHIGMITTRFIGSTDSLKVSTTSANAGQGNAWLKIHNLTNLPLSLNNEEIKIAPHSTYRYLGYLNQGVTLGTWFRDDSGMYPTYQYLQPYSDLYYGIVSDIKQSLEGCVQYGEYNDICDYGQTLWPLADGVM